MKKLTTLLLSALPVSYTHLDVYKRQVVIGLVRWPVKSSIFLPIQII